MAHRIGKSKGPAGARFWPLRFGNLRCREKMHTTSKLSDHVRLNYADLVLLHPFCPSRNPSPPATVFFLFFTFFSGTKPTRGKRKIQIQKDRGRLCSRHVTNVQNRGPLVSIKIKTYNKRETRRGSRDECQKSQPPRFDSNVVLCGFFPRSIFFLFISVPHP